MGWWDRKLKSWFFLPRWCISSHSWRGNGLFIQLTTSQDVEPTSNRWLSIVSLLGHIDKKTKQKNPLCLNYQLQTQTAVFNTTEKIKKYISMASVAVVTSTKIYYPRAAVNFRPQQLLLVLWDFNREPPFVFCALNEPLILFKWPSMFTAVATEGIMLNCVVVSFLLALYRKCVWQIAFSFIGKLVMKYVCLI